MDIIKKRRKTDPDFVATLSKKRRRMHRNQRVDRGWSDIDAWNADGYFAKVIYEMVLHHKTLPYWPGFEISPEQWVKIIDDIAIPLKQYSDRYKDGHDLSNEEIDNAEKALHLFADHFRMFWF